MIIHASAALVTIAVLLIPVGARGHQSPPGCSANDLDADIAIPPIFTGGAACGTVVPFTVTVSNGSSAGACDVTNAPITFTCPNPASGSPAGPVTTLDPAAAFSAVPPSSTTYPAVGCQIGDTSSGTCVCGAPIYQAQTQAGPGTLHLNPLDIDIALVLKTLSVPCIGINVPRHYQCFELKPTNFPSPPLTLVDQFGATSGTVRAPDRLCNPANKNGEDPLAPADPNHLVGYELRGISTPYLPVRNVSVTNQFGTIQVDLKRLVRLLVPASKSLVAPPGPLPNPTVDHFNCYLVERSKGAPPFTAIPGVTVDDQFGPVTLDVTGPRYLCAPADKNGEDPSAPGEPGHLMCYFTKHPREQFTLPPVFVEDQFGARTERVIRRDEFCVPSLVTLAP